MRDISSVDGLFDTPVPDTIRVAAHAACIDHFVKMILQKQPSVDSFLSAIPGEHTSLPCSIAQSGARLPTSMLALPSLESHAEKVPDQARAGLGARHQRAGFCI